jgi:hypothetical protein
VVADLFMTTVCLIVVGAENEEVRAVLICTVSESSLSLQNDLAECLA